MTFLTARIRNISIGQPFAIGQRADILLGDLDDDMGTSVKVAVKVIRAVPYDDITARQELRQSLEAHLDVWCALKHPNITEFLGLSYDVPFPTAIILPYYSKGNALDFIRKEESPNVPKLIYGAAKGLEYLHEQSPPIIHADIRACNVLVDDEGNARLVDFAMIPALSTTTFITTAVADPCRWRAPEVFLTDEEDGSQFTLKSDVFSFAMFAVELLTKERPFNHRILDTEVIWDITHGLRPHKPSSPLVDPFWPTLEACWVQAPDNRPDMLTICKQLEMDL